MNKPFKPDYPADGHVLGQSGGARETSGVLKTAGFPGQGVEIVFPPDERTRVEGTTSYPWNTIGQLIMQFPNGEFYTGTATLVDGKHVLTAAHNVFGNDLGGFARNVWFVPARSHDDMPYGIAEAERVFITEEYYTLSPANPNQTPDGEVDDVTPYTEDYAIVRLKARLNLPIMGLYGASDTELSGASARITGYPGDKPNDYMWTAAGPISAPDEEFIFYRIDTYKGESGAGVMFDFSLPVGLAVSGVHVAGDAKLGTNFAVRLNSQRIGQILKWMNA